MAPFIQSVPELDLYLVLTMFVMQFLHIQEMMPSRGNNKCDNLVLAV